MNSARKSLSTRVGFALALSIFALISVSCSNIDTGSGSEIIVVFSGAGSDCSTAPQNYVIDLNGKPSWFLRVNTDVPITNKSCDFTKVSLGVYSAAGNGGVATGSSCTIGCHFDTELVAGTYQVLLSGQPTDVFVSVYDSTKGDSPPNPPIVDA